MIENNDSPKPATQERVNLLAAEVEKLLRDNALLQNNKEFLKRQLIDRDNELAAVMQPLVDAIFMHGKQQLRDLIATEITDHFSSEDLANEIVESGAFADGVKEVVSNMDIEVRIGR